MTVELLPIVITTVIGALALAGAVTLINLIGKSSVRGRKRTTWLCVAFALAGVVGVGVLSIASVYYVMPVGWMVALGVAGLMVVILFVLIGTDVRWRLSRLLALVGVFIASSIAFGMIAMIGIGGDAIRPIYAVRAQQIAEANGFAALMPRSHKLPTDFLPVEALPAPNGGVSFSYDGFTLQERKAPKPMTEMDLWKLVAAGTAPTGEATVAADAKITSLVVRGRPAVGVKFVYFPAGDYVSKSSGDTVTVLVLELDGVDVRFSSSGGEKRASDGGWAPFEALSVDELARIAGTLAPVK